MSMFDLAAVAATSLVTEPFKYVVVSGAVSGQALERARADFPRITKPGIFPLSELRFGAGFGGLVDEIRGPALEAVLAEKFGLPLSGLPLMITVRGQCRRKDGRIHLDAGWKKLTALLYLNESWEDSGGRIRFLHGPDNLDDVIAEVPPDGGTLVVFETNDKAYHGHHPFVGPRRYVMFNWVSNTAAMERELARHRFSARMKRWLPF